MFKVKSNMIIILIIVMAITSSCEAENFTFFQRDYDITLDICKCTYFNKTVYKHFKAEFVLYNRTTRVFNASWEQIANLGRDMMVQIQVYKMASNEYRFFPLFFSANMCAEYIRNAFGIMDMITKTSNQNLCNAKEGVYYVKNAMPDFSKYPPHLPRGLYKIVCNSTYHSYLINSLEFYGKIKDKPIDWQNIPSHN